MSTRFNIVFAFTLLFSSAASAEDGHPFEIQWETLAPAEGNQYRDPFAGLSRQQLQSLGFVARIQRLIAAEKIPQDGSSAAEAAKFAEQLEKEGIDVLWLLAQQKRVTLLRQKQEQSLTKSIAERIDNRQVRLSGYVLPLKTTDGRVTEFYLVPSIDTCSHASAPPADQVVFVANKKGIVVNNRRTPVVVTGQVVAKQTIRFIPGSAGPKRIIAAYAIEFPKAEVIAFTNQRHDSRTTLKTD
jgi:uncharacterized protein